MATLDGAVLGDRVAARSGRWVPPTSVLAPTAAGLALGGLLLTSDDGISAAEWVRAGLVLAWALAGLALVVRPALRHLGTIMLVAAVLAGFCTSLAPGMCSAR
jgi:hypothetical protein